MTSQPRIVASAILACLAFQLDRPDHFRFECLLSHVLILRNVCACAFIVYGCLIMRVSAGQDLPRDLLLPSYVFPVSLLALLAVVLGVLLASLPFNAPK